MSGKACLHAMGAKANVAADVFACGFGTIADQTVAMVHTILERIQGPK